MRLSEELSNQIENFKTDEQELDVILEDYDLDASMNKDFNTIDSEFQKLQIEYKSLLNTRRFLRDG